MAKLAVSLTAFLDFAAAAGTAKAARLREAKRQLEGEHFDYWLALRNAIVSLHQENRPPSTLSRVLQGLDDRKTENYTECIDGYRRWLGKKRPQALLGRIRGTWTWGDLTVRVNPELTVDISHERYAIKLYFSAPPLSKARIEVCQHLVRKVVNQNMCPAILDVRRSRWYASNLRDTNVADALLDGEAHLFLSMWDTI